VCVGCNHLAVMRGGSVVGQTVQPVQAWENGCFKLYDCLIDVYNDHKNPKRIPGYAFRIFSELPTDRPTRGAPPSPPFSLSQVGSLKKYNLHILLI